ncbi:MAG: glycosyl transferase [Treponema sp.]|nr:glycosyl transferase [Treponema sp.]
MIPKIIHLCWMSGEAYPEKIQLCIDSWKKYLPDYEIMLWNAQTFDVNITKWTKEAFECKKYAFVADYVRFWALHEYGGIYFDSDVEVVRSLDCFLDCDCFFGYEYSGLPEAAVVGAVRNLKWMEHALQWYEQSTFVKSNGEYNAVVAPLIFRYAFEKETGVRLHGSAKAFQKNNVLFQVFSESYFSPKDGYNGKIYMTKNTYTIHHFQAAWKRNTIKNRLNKFLHFFVKRCLGRELFFKIMYYFRSKKIKTNFYFICS